ncbi:MAG TPA: 30S ribosomal protein S9 [Flavobacteriales bacterium]|jgi:small subunit ribosomal protein S9|nr:30S ribosomal protein S9 [Flavobacteriales bacterium]HPH82577.1 30S ribosomal protein S9 [Flavobacteriales bacterium]
METINTSGRRKTAVARVYLKPGTGKITINKRDISDYFTVPTLRGKVLQPFLVTEHEGKFDVTANIQGGGITGQAGALSLAIAKALVELDAANKPALRTNGLVTRDPRMVERKKPGQKKARKRFQFSKR